MSPRRVVSRLLLACITLIAAVSIRPIALTAQTNKDLPNVVVLATGGTIAGAAASDVQVGYTVPYALGNILLTAWGPVIVLLTR